MKVEVASPVTALPAQQPKRPHESGSIVQAAIPVFADESKVMKQAAELATSLGFSQPSYDVEKDDENPGFYRGRPRFGDDPRIPMTLASSQSCTGLRQPS